MKKLFWMTATMLLAMGLAVAQQTTPPPSSTPDNSQNPSTNQTNPTTDQSNPASTPTAPSTSNPSATSGASQNPVTASAMRGCITASGDNFVFTAQSGKNYNLKGMSDRVQANVGKTVDLSGQPAGTTTNNMQDFNVSDLATVSDNCQIAGVQSAAPSTSASTSQPATPSAEQNAAANPPAAPAENQPAATAAAPSGTEAGTTASTAPSTTEQNATQGETQPSENAQVAQNQEKLPQTASPLPLLALLGLGSLVGGYFSRKK